VISIGNYAFYSSDFDGDLVIGSSVESIGDEAFSYCNNLSGTVYIRAVNPPQYSNNIFASAFPLNNLHVPCNSLNAYKDLPVWKDFTNKYEDLSFSIDFTHSPWGTAAVTVPNTCTNNMATIEATPNHGYVFAGWSDGNTDNPRDVAVESNMVFTPLFDVQLQAFNDTVILTNTTDVINVKYNDVIPVGCSPVDLTIEAGPLSGNVAKIENGGIRYTPATGFYGVDSLVYRLSCTLSGIAEAKVYIIVNKPVADPYIACAGSSVPAGFVEIKDVTYYWYTAETGGSPDGAAMNVRNCVAPGEWWIEARYKDKPVSPRVRIFIDVYPALTSGIIGEGQAICSGNIPGQLTVTDGTIGGDGSYTYQWQESSDGTDWTPIANATTDTYSPPALTEDRYYRLNITRCTTVSSNAVKIKVYPASLFNYSDIRIHACPDAGTSINLSKYIDTLEVTSLKWESISPKVPITDITGSGIISSGTISTASLGVHPLVYTFVYTVSNPCATDIKRKVYFETLKPGRMRPVRDTVEICYEDAEAVQINQLFGIDARGTWTYHSSVPNDVNAYVTESTSAVYGGAVTMNGKAVYKDPSIASYNYHGITDAKKVEFIYTTHHDSCLHGEVYKMVIILTPDIINN
jgi:hypothetical protein